MAVTYKKLWHLLIDRNLMKKDLEEMAGITHYQMCKLARDKDVIIILRFYFGKTLREISLQMDISYAYVKVLQNKAFEGIKRFFENQHPFFLAFRIKV